MNQSGRSIPKAALEDIRTEEPKQRTTHQSRETIVFVTAFFNLVVRVDIGFPAERRHRIVGQMLESQLFAMARQTQHLALHNGGGMNDGGPLRDVFSEESQDVVGIGGVEESTHEIVSPAAQ